MEEEKYSILVFDIQSSVLYATLYHDIVGVYLMPCPFSQWKEAKEAREGESRGGGGSLMTQLAFLYSTIYT